MRNSSCMQFFGFGMVFKSIDDLHTLALSNGRQSASHQRTKWHVRRGHPLTTRRRTSGVVMCEHTMDKTPSAPTKPRHFGIKRARQHEHSLAVALRFMILSHAICSSGVTFRCLFQTHSAQTHAHTLHQSDVRRRIVSIVWQTGIPRETWCAEAVAFPSGHKCALVPCR